jgi:isochorismate synthase
MAQETRALVEDAHLMQPNPRPPAPPLLVGGFAFADDGGRGAWSGFGAARLCLPELAFVRREGLATAVVWQPLEPGGDPEAAARSGRETRERWERSAADTTPAAPAPLAAAPEFHACADAPHAAFTASVESALHAIADGDFEKVVTARSVRLRQPGGFEVSAVFDGLRRSQPSCTSFAVARDDDAFIGATPEPLVRLAGRAVEAAAVAGSAPRGRSPEEDARLGRALAGSRKEHAEHAVVVRVLCECLASLCEGVRSPETPRLLRLEGIQHLETPVSARLRGDVTLLDLVGRIHPTPAVGGAPRRAALDWLAEHEDLERGWYAGPVGFVDAEGGGEFCVALRSALLHGEEAQLYAGAGIVAGSEPASELRETQLKLRAMLSALVEL